MRIHFYKYEGTGNDFIVLDFTQKTFTLDKNHIIKLCDRHLGIGSDGLIVLKKTSMADFEMSFFNPDGSCGMMCGNGGRVAALAANDFGIISNEVMSFKAPDGIHFAKIQDNYNISLKMNIVSGYKVFKDGIWLDTGTSHFVVKVNDLKNMDVLSVGKKLRDSKRFSKYGGANINFYKAKKKNELNIRTFEKGVENETLACGTGITATALAYCIIEKMKDGKHTIKVNALGGILKVDFVKQKDEFSNIILTGNANKVFEGNIDI